MNEYNDDYMREDIPPTRRGSQRELVARKRRRERTRRRRARLSPLTLVLLVICAGASGFMGGYLSGHFAPGARPSGDTSQLPIVRTIATAEVGAPSLPEVAAAVKPTVVEITTEAVVTMQGRSRRAGQYVREGAGSGVVITGDGYIVTNAHVVDGAQSIRVRLSNGDVYDAQLTGANSENDLAVIKIDAQAISPAVLGHSSSLLVGEGAVAVGNPLGELGGTVTSGIISALDRQIDIDGVTMTLLQTSAAINPGNSGGGLFSLSGELIGIVNAKSAGSDIEGLGFAIPIDTAVPILESILSQHGASLGARE